MTLLDGAGVRRASAVDALSIAEPVVAWLHAGPHQLRVHSSFHRALNLVAGDGRLLTLHAAGVAHGPFALRLPLDHMPAVAPGQTVGMQGGVLAVGGLRVRWDSAACWDPKLHPLLRPKLTVGPVVRRLSQIDAALVCALMVPAPTRPRARIAVEQDGILPCMAGLVHRMGDHIASLRAGLAGDEASLAQALAGLVGFGPGLTPAGDDCIVGLLAARRMLGQAPGAVESLLASGIAASREAPAECPRHGALCGATPGPGCSRDAFTLAEAFASRTTSLSAAFLSAALRGHFAAHWHTLRQAVHGGEPTRIAAAAGRLLAYGASSGADALVGWLLGMRAHASPTLTAPELMAVVGGRGAQPRAPASR